MSTLHSSWREGGGRIDPFMLLWPIDPVKSKDGTKINEPVLRELPEDRGTWGKLMEGDVERLDAGAICLVHGTDGGVEVLLETAHGTRRWKYPKVRRGDADFLGTPTHDDNSAHLGVLWFPNP